MIPLALDEVRELCAGDVDAAAGATLVTGVQIDSRRVSPGDLFVAIGRGRDFRDEALERGAAATVVPEDPFAGLAALARSVRARTSARVVGITGSVGKTSTKDILAALCRPHARVVAAEEGFNNEIGLPLTVLRAEAETDILIAELGMRGLGQIRELCEIARPEVAVITSVGPAHLELLGSLERVAEAKVEVVASLPPGGTAIVPTGPTELVARLRRTDIELVFFESIEHGGGDLRLVEFSPPRLVADLAGERVALAVPFTARHQAHNALAALGAYRALGLPLERVADGAGSITFSRARCEEFELDGVLLIDDAYNANPDSMRTALDHLKNRGRGRRTIAVLGGMAELGRESRRYHREVAASADVDVLVAVGDQARDYEHAPARECRWVATRDEALAELRSLLRPGDVVLVKASRAYGLEGFAAELTNVHA